MNKGKRIRILLVKTSLDGHIRGIVVVGRALRDAGMEVIYGGTLTPDRIVETAIQEDVDVLGLNVGGNSAIVHRIVDLLREKNTDDILIVGGGPITPDEITDLKRIGVNEFFPPGSSLPSIIDYIKAELSN